MLKGNTPHCPLIATTLCLDEVEEDSGWSVLKGAVDRLGSGKTGDRLVNLARSPFWGQETSLDGSQKKNNIFEK